MVGVVLTGHGHFASGLADALEMIAGPQEAFYPVTFLADEAGSYPEKLKNAVREAAKEKGEALVLCDFVGGTPFNQSMLIGAEEEGVEVVAGANLPMLLELLTVRNVESSVSELVACAVEAGSTGVAHMTLDVDNTDDSFGDDDFDGI